MSEVAKIIPLRCHGCHLFYDDLQRAQAFEAEIAILDEETEREQLVAQSHERKDLERRLAQALLGLGYLKEKIEDGQFYTVGCPGFDMSDSTRIGEAVWIGRCRSPIFEL